jgi:peptide/nickel transport system ATP-binding protein
MYAGQLVEVSSTEALFANPLHPYSKGLLDAFPSIRGPRRALTGIPGSPPDLGHPPAGCRFQPRCPSAMERCATEIPALGWVGQSQVRCFLYSAERAEAV